MSQTNKRLGLCVSVMACYAALVTLAVIVKNLFSSLVLFLCLFAGRRLSKRQAAPLVMLYIETTTHNFINFRLCLLSPYLAEPVKKQVTVT